MSKPSEFVFSQPGKLRLYSTVELLTLPPPRWLVDTILPESGVCVLYGPPESLKSFLGIDFALCVATGRAWHGYSVRQGLAVYLAAEGGAGLTKRARAWLQHYQVDPKTPEIAWLIESMMMTRESEDLLTLIDRFDEIDRAPKFIVVDTVARCLEGDENKTQDMNAFVAGLDHLRQTYGTTLLAIHHTGWSAEHERGASSLRGGTDTVLSVKRSAQQGPITMECKKQKDAEHFPDLEFGLQLIQGTDSCVVVRTDNQIDREMDENIQQILAILTTAGPLTWEDWFSFSSTNKTRFFRLFVKLKKSGQIIKENGRWQVKS